MVWTCEALEVFCGTIPQKGECVGPNLFIEVVMWILTCCTAGLSCGSKEKRFRAVKPVKSETFRYVHTVDYTLPETNIAPKNGWLEYYFPIGKAYFQGLC